jgi:hypothetical protein
MNKSLEQCRELGLSLAETARYLGVTPQAVSAEVKASGRGWPCPKCGYGDDQTVIRAGHCPQCPKATPTPPRLCLDCANPTGRGIRALYCTHCLHSRRVAGIRAIQRRQDRALASTATRNGRPFSLPDDAMIFSGLTVAELARNLRRTRASIVNRRAYLSQGDVRD